MEHAEVVETNVNRLDPRDLNSIIQAVKADAPSSSQQTSAAYSFKGEEFGRQHEFNSSLVRKLSNVHCSEDIETVIPEVIHEPNVRNERLKIANSHPQVFQFLDIKTMAESFMSMDPRLSEFMESIKKRGRRQEKKTVHVLNALSEAGNSMVTCFLQPSLVSRLFQLE
ncbi:unnamed protein product [Heligmosomoides polygyrus]|uniref:RPAP3_C domain-containing protein n=1 Tax=Heligmosomoides polygyrus TaxID=6339 RepID=A0A183G4M1_HELPZ|nr:unnamed protein product [Heligmosomoides polygyrus]